MDPAARHVLGVKVFEQLGGGHLLEYLGQQPTQGDPVGRIVLLSGPEE